MVLLSAAVGLLAFRHLGVMHGGDTMRYLSGATHLIAGEPFQEKEASYVGYIAVVAAMRLLGIGEVGVVLLQLAAAALAALALYDMGHRLAGPLAGALAAGAFILNPDLLRWHCYILTDSLYISLVVFTTWTAHRAARLRGWWYPAASLVLLAAAFTRPSGWVLVPLVVAYWLLTARWSRRVRCAAVGGLFAACAAGAVSVPSLRRGIESQGPVQSLRKGEVVWGFQGWHVPMPSDPAAGADLRSGAGYVARHPLAVTRLGATRIAAELAHVRPFYSRVHNLAVLIFLAAVYPLALAGFIRHRRSPLCQLAALIVVGHLAVIALTFADWDGRFLLHFLPLLLLFAACAVPHLLSVLKRYRAPLHARLS